MCNECLKGGTLLGPPFAVSRCDVTCMPCLNLLEVARNVSSLIEISNE